MLSKPSSLAGGLLATLCLFGAEAQAANPQPVGTKIRPSNCTDCAQALPAVAGAPSGNFVVVWDGSSPSDPHAVLRRRFNPAGVPQGGDVLANTEPQLEQSGGAVAIDSQGRAVVVWSQTSGGNRDIFARRFRPNGSPLGSVIQVSADQAGTSSIPQDFSPAVAATLDGGFVVVWVRVLPPGEGVSGTTPQVWARRFSAGAAPVHAPVQLSTGLPSGEQPDVCVDSVNRAVAVWTTVDEFRPFQASLEGVTARRLSPAGAAVGGEIVVAPPTVTRSSDAAVSCGKGSTFVVAWQTDQAPAQQRLDIVAQRFTRNGRPAAAAARVNTTVDGDQKAPAISHDPAGNFVIVWESDTRTVSGISGRRFNANGAPVSEELVVESTAEGNLQPTEPDVAHVGTAGGFVVVWQDTRQKLAGQRYNP